MLRTARFAARVVAALALPVAALTVTAGAAEAAGPTVYFVSPTGSDSNAGTSPDQAFASLGRASQVTHVPGDRILLQRGATYSGTLTIKGAGTQAQPIVVDAYGTGRRPLLTNGGCLQLNAAWTVARNLITDSCTWTGVDVNAANNTVSGMRVSRNISGIKIEQAGTGADILNNRVVDNNRMAPNTPGDNDDYGAFSIEVLGDNANIGYNRISGANAPSPDYGTDGSAVEIYGAQHTVVHHNIAWDNQAFTELGNPRTADTTYDYNVVRSSLPYSAFIVTRGSGDYWGPAAATVADHNTVSMTGQGSVAFWCGGTCGPTVLSMSDNILVAAATVGQATAPTSGPYAGQAIGGGDNIYWGSVVQFPMMPGDRQVNPQFVNQSTLKVAATSPAIDKGTMAGWDHDARGRLADLDGNNDGVAAPDLGAQEFAGR